MFRILSITVQTSIILILVLAVFNNSFIISFEIKDFIYSVSSTYIFIPLLIFFVLIFLLQTFYFKTKFSFSKFIAIKKLQNKEKGYNAFVSGMIALANKDYKRAILESKKISNHLDDNPSLALLLKSEIFKVEKKYDELSVVYEDMSKNKHTENLGYRGMMEQYLRAQDYHHAFIYGERLFNNNPFIEKIYDTLVSIIAKTNNWQQLLIISDRAFSKKIIDKKVYEENKSIGFFEIAKIKQLSEIEESLKYMQKALKLRKNFPPYIKTYIQILSIHNPPKNLLFFLLTFSIEDPTLLKQQARKLAIKDAQARAEVMATAAGVTVGKPIRIQETSWGGPIVRSDSLEKAAVAADVPIQLPGEIDLTINLQVVFEIR